MALCDILLNANIQAKCKDPFYGTYKQEGWIINKSDIASYELDADGVNVSSLTLKSGAMAYKIQSTGQQPTATTQTFVKGNYYNKWNVVVNVAVVDHGAEIIRDIIRPLQSSSKFVVILEHEYQNMCEVFGLAKGLSLQDGASREEYNEDLNGGWNLPLEENGSPMPSYFIDKSIVEGLQTPEA